MHVWDYGAIGVSQSPVLIGAWGIGNGIDRGGVSAIGSGGRFSQR